MWLGIPLFLVTIMYTFFGTEPPKPQGLLLIADEDETFISRALATVYSQGKLGEMIKTEKVKQPAGRERMEKGDASALLIIPKGFGDAFLDNKPFRIPLVTNPSFRIMPRLIEESLAIMFDGAHYLQRIAGDEIRSVGRADRPSDLQVTETSLRFKRISESLRRYLDPRLIDLETEISSAERKPAKSFGAMFFPSMLFLSFLFIAQGIAMDLWKERTQGALRRFVSTPSSLGSWLGGKLLAAAMVFVIVTCLGMLCAHTLLNLNIDHFVPAFLWACGSALGLLVFMMLLVIYAPSERGAGVICNLVTFPLMASGGSFFPFDLMPENIASIGRLTPNGWSLMKFQQILDGKAGGGELAIAFGALLVFLALASTIVSLRLRRSFAA